MTTWRDPHLPPVYHWQYEMSSFFIKKSSNISWGLRSLKDLTKHLHLKYLLSLKGLDYTFILLVEKSLFVKKNTKNNRKTNYTYFLLWIEFLLKNLVIIKWNLHFIEFNKDKKQESTCYAISILLVSMHKKNANKVVTGLYKKIYLVLLFKWNEQIYIISVVLPSFNCKLGIT